MAGVGALSALCQGDAIGADAARLVSAFSGGATNGHNAISFGHGFPVRPIGQVEAMWRCLFKDIHPLAQHAPVLPGASDLRLTLDHDKDYLGVACCLSGGIASIQVIKREADVTPAGTLRRDLMHLATGSEGPFQKVSHR